VYVATRRIHEQRVVVAVAPIIVDRGVAVVNATAILC
jgi:hypothetical protein